MAAVSAAEIKALRPRRPPLQLKAFTLLELLVVITIIIALAGLILATVGYVQKKGARSRAEAEMAGMSAASESYKADNGIYPNTSNTTSFTPSDTNQANYKAASLDLYKALTGQNADGHPLRARRITWHLNRHRSDARI